MLFYLLFLKIFFYSEVPQVSCYIFLKIIFHIDTDSQVRFLYCILFLFHTHDHDVVYGYGLWLEELVP